MDVLFGQLHLHGRRIGMIRLGGGYYLDNDVRTLKPVSETAEIDVIFTPSEDTGKVRGVSLEAHRMRSIPARDRQVQRIESVPKTAASSLISAPASVLILVAATTIGRRRLLNPAGWGFGYVTSLWKASVRYV